MESKETIGLAFAGIGAILVIVTALAVDGGYWLLMTGSAFVIVGVFWYILGRRQSSAEKE